MKKSKKEITSFLIETRVPAFWYKMRKKIIGTNVTAESDKNIGGKIVKVIKRKGGIYCQIAPKNKKTLEKLACYDVVSMALSADVDKHYVDGRTILHKGFL